MQSRQHGGVSDTPAETGAVGGGAPTVQKYKGKTAVVVGAGPGGLTAAAYLAKHGFTVKVFEGRKNISSSTVEGARTINIVLSGTTPDVFREVGAELPTREGGFKNGLHAFKGAHIWTDENCASVPTTTTNTVIGTRYFVTKTLLDVIEKDYSSDVSLYFNHPCKSVSFEDRKVKFEDASGKEVVVDYDLLIAADGANSTVRKDLQRIDKSIRVYGATSGRSYFGVSGLEVDRDDSWSKEIKAGWFNLARSTSVTTKKYATSFACVLTPDGTAHGVFVGRSEFFEFIKGNEEKWLDDVLPNVIPQSWKQRMIQQIENVRLSKTPAVTFLSKYNGPRTILIGDAAHSVSPGSGFGCNMAVGDGKALSEALQAADGQLDAIPRKFDNVRRKTCQSYQLMEAGNSVDGYKFTRSLVIWRLFYRLHRSAYNLIGKLLSKGGTLTVQTRVWERKITPVDAVNIIKRDCLVAGVGGVGFLFLAARHIVAPVVKFVLSKLPLSGQPTK